MTIELIVGKSIHENRRKSRLYNENSLNEINEFEPILREFNELQFDIRNDPSLAEDT